MTELRYDPARLGPLRSRASAAWQHLLRTSSDDPAAASALRVAGQVRAGLEHGWLPAIDRLLASDAMLTWIASGPAWMRGLAGDELGRELAARADDLCVDARDDRVAELVDALRLAAPDEEAMATFFSELGPDRLIELLTLLATVDQERTELPDELRAALVRTAAAGGVPASYGGQLVRAAASRHEQLGRNGDDALTLGYLFHGAQLPSDLVVDAVVTAIAVEREYAAANGVEPAGGWTLWSADQWRNVSALRLDFTEPRDNGWTPPAAYDPMYALLGQLVGDGRAGRIVFRDREHAEYLFGQRDVLADGGRAIVSAAATAAAGPDVVPGAPRQLLDDASLVASGFVTHFGRTNAGRADADDTIATAAARLVGAHLFAVDVALSSHDVTDDERLGALSPSERQALQDAGVLDEDGRLRDGVMATGTVHHDVLGPDDPRRAAVFQPAALDPILDLAAATDASSIALRDALATYQRGLASTAAARIAAGEVVDPDRYLAEVTSDAARLEGRFVAHVGHQAERRGRDADEMLGFWIRAAGEGAERAGGLLGPAGSFVVGTAADPAADLAVEVLASGEDRAEADADRLARMAGEQLAYVWYRELHDAGVIRTQLPADLAPAGRLPAYGELVRRVYARPAGDWTVERVLNELDVAASDAQVDLDGRALRESMTLAQLPHYTELAD